MIDIVRDLHKLVPIVKEADGNEVFDRVSVVGDQKTIERGVEAQFSVQNAYTKSRRLEGVFFQLADWHHENKFLSVRYCNYFLTNLCFNKPIQTFRFCIIIILCFAAVCVSYIVAMTTQMILHCYTFSHT